MEFCILDLRFLFSLRSFALLSCWWKVHHDSVRNCMTRLPLLIVARLLCVCASAPSLSCPSCVARYICRLHDSILITFSSSLMCLLLLFWSGFGAFTSFCLVLEVNTRFWGSAMVFTEGAVGMFKGDSGFDLVSCSVFGTSGFVWFWSLCRRSDVRFSLVCWVRVRPGSFRVKVGVFSSLVFNVIKDEIFSGSILL